MKKVLFILFFATLSLGSYAQKGMQGVGLSIDGGFITSNEEYGNVLPITTLKYQYYIHDNIRLVPSLAMGVSCDEVGFHVNPYIKADIFLTPISKFRVYASAGLGYAYTRTTGLRIEYRYKYTSNGFYYEHDGHYEYYDAPPHFFSYLLGIGVEWRVAYNWTIQLSGNFDGLDGTYEEEWNNEIESDYGFGGHLSLGFVYNF